MLKISETGNRICIIGPSNSGKSTLAQTMSHILNIPAIHLDRLAHYPNSNWVRRPNDEFTKLHDTEILNEKWIIEGNYSIAMPQRFARADTVIWLDPSIIGCTLRYLKRCLKNKSDRAGNLDGATKEFNIDLIKYTWFIYPKNRKKYEEILQSFHGNIIHIHSINELNRYIQH